MRVAISGSSGFIGGYVFRALQKEKQVRLSLLRWRDGDWKILQQDEQEIGRMSSSLDVDCVILIGASMPKNHQELNDPDSAFSSVSSTLKFTQIPDSGPMRILYFSTVDVYPASGSVSESTAPNPTTLYGESKLMSEKILLEWAQRSGHTLCILRIGTVFGPGDSSSQKVIPAMLRSASEKSVLELDGDGTERRSFLAVNDLSCMVVDLVSRTHVPAIVNIVGTQSISMKDLAGLVADLFSTPITIGHRPKSEITRDQNFDKDLMHEIFRQEQTSFHLALKQTLANAQT